MAISKERWDKAKALFDSGASDLEVAQKTRINRSTIAKKSKKEGWVRGINSGLIDNEINLIRDKSQLNHIETEIHNDNVNRQVKLLGLLDDFSDITMGQANKLMTVTDSGQDFKAIIDGVDKHTVTMGLNQRHANSQINMQQNNDSSTKVIEIVDV